MDLIWIMELTTPLFFSTFIVLVIWAMQRKRNAAFEAASKLPLSDGDDTAKV